jgi:hypothetical protein
MVGTKDYLTREKAKKDAKEAKILRDFRRDAGYAIRLNTHPFGALRLRQTCYVNAPHIRR